MSALIKINPPDQIRRGITTSRLGYSPEKGKYHFKEVLTVLNWVLRLVPRPFTTAMIASEMPAAIKPYSIAVAPD